MFSGIVQTFRMEPNRAGFGPRNAFQCQIFNTHSLIIDKDNVFRDSDDVTMSGAEDSAYLGAVLSGQGL